ncbi:class I SAM-dependent methyltransferase [Maridesulfovibrio sp.]|uniref:class I SAM-dependent methyltransferase n=1 Tax=Maridesulfovibrio sp. TaxID=2795000 RepID=UPI0029F51BF6|nr:class I SAM-dependent methyltransferase [Maridesulfovibrio sp.]
MSKVNKSIRDQYNKYPYPEPVKDMEEYLKVTNYESCPTLNSNLLWPTTGYPEKPFNILCAGCGSSEAVGLAMKNPLANVIGIDISNSSLSHSKSLKKKHKLANLTLKKLDLHQVESLGQKFDLIVSSGVLHHLPDPKTGFQALRKVLADDGSFTCMLYGKYGRVGVYMFQELAKLLDLKQDDDSVSVLKEMCATVPALHPVKLVTDAFHDSKYDAGLVDLFLNPQDTAFSVKDIMQMADDTDFVFHTWLDNYLYYPQSLPVAQTQLFNKISALPAQQQWEFMEKFTCAIPRHSFILTHPDRDPEDYAIDFNENTIDKYIPVWAPSTFVTSPLNMEPFGQVNYRRKKYDFAANEYGAKLLGYMNGKNTAQKCIELARKALGNKELDFFPVFDYMYRAGHVQMLIKK